MEEKKILSRTAFKQLATFLTILLVLCVSIMVSTQFIPQVEAARTRVFTEDFNSYSNTWWTTYQGTPVIESGALKLNQARCHGAVYTKYCNMTVRAKVSATITAGAPTFGLLTNYTAPDNQEYTIRIFFFSDGYVYGLCQKGPGASTQVALQTYTGNTYYKFMVIWDSSSVKFYVDGVLKQTVNTNIIQSRAKPWLSQPDSAQSLYIDYFYLEEERETSYLRPDICYANITNWINPSWTEGNKTLWASMTGSGTYVYKIYVPSTYAQYFAEVKKNGVAYTNFSFDMASRELLIKGLTGTVVSAAFVDPPQILVNLYYWLLGFGISIAPLLKIWDKLAKIHKLLPYLGIAIAIAFLVVAAWYAWIYLSAWRLS